jgi:TfoX/Sxy family transcriptional regulator of competence genes
LTNSSWAISLPAGLHKYGEPDPYDQQLAGRIRKIFRRGAVTEKAMFGGLAFLLEGRMCCGILNDDLVVRVGPERYEDALREADVRPMDFTGRPMKGYVFVGSRATNDEASLAAWVGRGADFVSTLPGRKAQERLRRRRRPKV